MGTNVEIKEQSRVKNNVDFHWRKLGNKDKLKQINQEEQILLAELSRMKSEPILWLKCTESVLVELDLFLHISEHMQTKITKHCSCHSFRLKKII